MKIYLLLLLGILCSFMILLSQNIIYSLFFLILTSLVSVILFIVVGREFVGFVFLIVYVGAICILFLFVVMMLNIQLTERTNKNKKYINFLYISIYILIYTCILVLYNDNIYLLNIENFGFNFLIFMNLEIKLLSSLIYEYYVLNFFLSGLILLIAMIGAITLSLDFNKSNVIIFKKQDVFTQLSKDLNVCVRLLKKKND
jgi:NADH-quinone oxidoreductase subunit J